MLDATHISLTVERVDYGSHIRKYYMVMRANNLPLPHVVQAHKW